MGNNQTSLSKKSSVIPNHMLENIGRFINIKDNKSSLDWLEQFEGDASVFALMEDIQINKLTFRSCKCIIDSEIREVAFCMIFLLDQPTCLEKIPYNIYINF